MCYLKTKSPPGVYHPAEWVRMDKDKGLVPTIHPRVGWSKLSNRQTDRDKQTNKHFETVNKTTVKKGAGDK